METTHFVTLVVVLGVAQFLLDASTNACRKKLVWNKAQYQLLWHHFLSAFLHFGWLARNKLILLLYIGLSAVTLYFWLSTGYCPITRTFDTACETKPGEYFHDFLYFSGLKELQGFDQLHTILLVTFLLFALLRLRRE
jgi:hypothetical protein